MKVLRALGLYAALTVVMTYPLAFRLTVMDPGDSAFFAWAIGWEIHALKTDPRSLPHANIYHPVRYALGMDEPVLGSMILALPFSLFTDDAVLLFGLTRLLTFVLSALGVYLLAREVQCGEAASLFAGAAFAFSPIRTDQIAHLSTLGTQWLPLFLLFLIRFSRTGRRRDAWLTGLFYVLVSLACGYHGLISVLVMPVAMLPLFWGRFRLLPRLALAGVLAGVALVPLYVLHRAGMEPHGFVRGTAETIFYSASLESFLATSPWNRLYGGLTAEFRTFASNLFPGLVVPSLVVSGVLALRRRGTWPDREVLALAAVAVTAALVALGPEVRLAGHTLFPGPFALVRDTFPLFEKIRVTSRAGVFMALALAVLAGRAVRSRRGPVVLAVAGLCLAEGVIAPIPLPQWMRVIDSSRPPPPVYRWLAEQPGDFAIAELPIVVHDGFFRRPAHDESIYMVYSTLHWKRLVNGYAGVEPAQYREVRALARRFPSEEFLGALRRLDVRYVVLHRAGYGPNQWARVERDLPNFDSGLKVVASFDGDTVYELVPPPKP